MTDPRRVLRRIDWVNVSVWTAVLLSSVVFWVWGTFTAYHAFVRIISNP